MPATAINLLGSDDFEKTPLGKFLRWSLTYGRYIIICTEIIVLLAFIFRFSLDRQITDLEEEVAQKIAIIEANEPFEQQFRILQARVNQIGLLTKNQTQNVIILRHLVEITPPGIIFTQYTYSEDAVEVLARANSSATLAQYIRALRGSDKLTDINVTTINKITAGSSETDFGLKAQIIK